MKRFFSRRLGSVIRLESSLLPFELHQLIMHVALAWNEAKLGDRIPNLPERQKMHGARLRHHIFLDHQAAHVIRAKQQRQLTNFETLGHPTRLNVREVVQI